MVKKDTKLVKIKEAALTLSVVYNSPVIFGYFFNTRSHYSAIRE